MEPEIFTCKYFKFGRNTTGLSQSHLRNFLACSINNRIFKIFNRKWSYDKMLIDWVRSGRTGKYLALGQDVQTSLRSVRTPWPRAKYFPVRPSHSVNKYILFFSPASERSGILNPWIWLANRARASGPYFPIRTPSYGPLLKVSGNRQCFAFFTLLINACLFLIHFQMARKVAVSKLKFNWMFWSCERLFLARHCNGA